MKHNVRIQNRYRQSGTVIFKMTKMAVRIVNNQNGRYKISNIEKMAVVKNSIDSIFQIQNSREKNSTNKTNRYHSDGQFGKV